MAVQIKDLPVFSLKINAYAKLTDLWWFNKHWRARFVAFPSKAEADIGKDILSTAEIVDFEFAEGVNPLSQAYALFKLAKVNQGFILEDI